MSTPIESTKGKRRLATPRLSDMGRSDGTNPAQSRRGAPVGNTNATYSASKRAARGPLESIVGEQVEQTMGSVPMPEESRLVADNALALAADAVRQVACPSPFVELFAQRFGLNAALAGFYTQKAAEAGFASPRGLELIEAAHRCEQQATRAMVGAEAAAKSFSKPRPGKTLDLSRAIEAASQERQR